MVCNVSIPNRVHFSNLSFFSHTLDDSVNIFLGLMSEFQQFHFYGTGTKYVFLFHFSIYHYQIRVFQHIHEACSDYVSYDKSE
jgi:hypothetical protein